VRWTGSEVTSCSLTGATWSPIDDDCFFPIDLLTEEGPLELVRTRRGVAESVTVRVAPYPYPVERIQVAERMANPPTEEIPRIRAEQARIAAIWERSDPRRFSLPLSSPLDPPPAARSFGSRRIINGEPRSPHSGVDFSARVGTAVHAVGRGTVALADELYFSGRSVFLDHGGGLFTMYFHLDEIAVGCGQRVDRGRVIGTVGSTGRVTGPHLHFAVRWHGARIDPTILLNDPETIPELVRSVDR
jgi:murein DD-endopeptidase MepM/ murein hydrolase activator NlpD